MDLLKENVDLNGTGRKEIVASFEVVRPGDWLAIHGIVHGIENLPAPLSKPFLSIGGQSGLRISDSPVGADGAFEFPKVLPGTYTISLRAWDSDGSRPSLLTRSVTVSKESSPLVVFDIPKSVLIQGRIVLDGHGPVPCLSLSLDENFSRIFRLMCQPDGTFTASLPAGEYKIQTWGFPSGYYWLKSFNYGDTDLLQQKIKIASDAKSLAITLGVMESAPWVKISGRTIGTAIPPGAAISKIYLFRLTGGQFEAPIQPDGSFEFPSILPGTYNAATQLNISNPRNNRFDVMEGGLFNLEVPVEQERK
jgi:hypothetical protein